MRSTLLGFFLAALLPLACAPARSGPHGGSGGTGGVASGGSGGAAGSGGSLGGAGGSGGTSNTGGTTATGGSAGDGGSGGDDNGGGGGGGGGSGGSGGNAGGSGGSAGSGGSSEPGSSTRPDGAADVRLGTDVLAGGAGGGTTARGGSGGAAGGGGGRGGSSGTSTTLAGGTGGKPGTGGAPGTGGNTAPTPCSFPSSWNPGSATYTTYSLPNASTACGYEGSNNTIKNIPNGGNFAAIPGNTSSDFNTRDRCGACVQIGGAVITIVDECPNDTNAPCKANPSGHLDLSNAGASAGGVKGDPAVRGQNQWKFVPCPANGNVVVRLKPGNDNEMFIENVILPVSAVTCDGQTGSRTSYGAWHFNQNIPGASCDVTDISNRKITIKAGTSQGQNVDTGVQFPKCQ
jgi:hypothetical protein